MEQPEPQAGARAVLHVPETLRERALTTEPTLCSGSQRPPAPSNGENPSPVPTFDASLEAWGLWRGRPLSRCWQTSGMLVGRLLQAICEAVRRLTSRSSCFLDGLSDEPLQSFP